MLPLAAMTAPSLPATANCPGCSTMVVLPAEPRTREEPLVCATCGTAFADPRIELLEAQAAAEARAAAEAAKPLEHRIYTRRGLLKGLRDAAADRALEAMRELGERARF